MVDRAQHSLSWSLRSTSRFVVVLAMLMALAVPVGVLHSWARTANTDTSVVAVAYGLLALLAVASVYAAYVAASLNLTVTGSTLRAGSGSLGHTFALDDVDRLVVVPNPAPASAYPDMLAVVFTSGSTKLLTDFVSGTTSYPHSVDWLADNVNNHLDKRRTVGTPGH